MENILNKTNLKSTLLSLLLLISSGVQAKSSSNNDELQFKSLKTVNCSADILDLSRDFEIMLATTKSDESELFILNHYRKIRCLSAKDFKKVYSQLLKAFPNPKKTPDIAPIIFMYHDMGARFIDSRSLAWLQTAIPAVMKLEYFIQFFMPLESELIALPAHVQEKILIAFEGDQFVATQCALADMSYDKMGNPFCPKDACDNPEKLAELSKNIDSTFLEKRCKTINSSKSGKGRKKLGQCFKKYSNNNLLTRQLACAKQARQVRFDNIMKPTMTVVKVSDACTIGQSYLDKQLAKKLERTKKQAEKKLRELQHAEKVLQKKLLDARMDDKHRNLKELRRQYLYNQEQQLKKIKEKEQIEKNLEILEEERKKKSTKRCTQFDGTCSDDCSIQDQQIQCELEAISDKTPPKKHSLNPLDPTIDPKNTDPAQNAEQAKTDLVSCITDALMASKPNEVNQCSKLIRCATGEPQQVGKDGNCSCEESTISYNNEQQRCQQAIQCQPGEACNCPSDSLGGINTPLNTPNGGGIIVQFQY